MKLIICYACFLWQVTHGIAQTPAAFPLHHAGAGAYSGKFIDVTSCRINVAALSRVSKRALGVYVTEPFGMKALRRVAFTAAIPVSAGGMGLMIDHVGFKNYRETQLSVGYARSLGKIALGISMGYQLLQVPGYGNNSAVAVAIGSVWQLTSKLFTGVQLTNPAGGKFLKQGKEPLPYSYSAGFGYELNEQVLLSAGFFKEEHKVSNGYVGMEYIFHPQFRVRAGIITAPAAPYAGAGWEWNAFRLLVTVNYHAQLGITPGLLFIIQEKKKDI